MGKYLSNKIKKKTELLDMNLVLKLVFAFALTAISATSKSEYEFTNEQVNCNFKKGSKKILCNLSGNVECAVSAKLPEKVLSDKKIDMLLVGFEAENDNIDSSNLEEIKFKLYPSNVIDKTLSKSEDALELSLDSADGFAVDDKKDSDTLIKGIRKRGCYLRRNLAQGLKINVCL